MLGKSIEILKWVREKTGIDASTLGPGAVDRALKSRMRELNFPSEAFGQYWELFTNSTDEQQKLIECVVVPETWFLRDQSVFQVFDQMITSLRRQGRILGQFRWLSLPCSTGEEAYSIAIVLEKSKALDGSGQVLGVELSSRSLEVARSAVYGPNSFRGIDADLRSEYFESVGKRYRVKREIREKVKFVRGNILDRNLWSSLGEFDVIFCRNLLIYFDSQSREKAIDHLIGGLSDGGFLCMTPAEAPMVWNRGFRSVPGLPICVFQKGGQVASSRGDHTAGHPILAELDTEGSKILGSRHGRIGRIRSEAKGNDLMGVIDPSQDKSRPVQLSKGFEAADRGDLDLARGICDQFIAKHGPDSAAYYLLGLINEVERNDLEAESLYRKSIYLNPKNVEAMLHLAMLLESKGDEKESHLLRSRAIRVRGEEVIK